MTFSLNGKVLAVGASAGGLTLWDVSDPGRPALRDRIDAGTGAGTIVGGAAFSADKQILAAGSASGQVRAVSGGPITAAEWARHVPGLPYKPPCPGSARE